MLKSDCEELINDVNERRMEDSKGEVRAAVRRMKRGMVVHITNLCRFRAVQERGRCTF